MITNDNLSKSKYENKTEKIERNYLFDNIKGILIFSVVIAHFFRASSSFSVPTFGGVTYIISFSYIMQGFLFISGYFSRNLEKCRNTAFQTFLFPYLILMPIMYCIRLSIFGKAHFDLTLPTMALWYLLTLFVYRFLLKDLVKFKMILPVSIAVSLTAGFFSVLDSTLSLGRTFSFLPFFLIGYYCSPEMIEKIRSMPRRISVFLMASLTAFSIYLVLHRVFPLEALYMKGAYTSTGLSNDQGILIRILVSALSLAWIVVMISLTPSKKTFLSSIGKNTMAVYVLHIIVRYAIKAAGSYFQQDLPSYLILIAAAMLSVWLFSRPAVADRYNQLIDQLYQWFVALPAELFRQICSVKIR